MKEPTTVEEAEAAGHELTLLSYHLGVSTYYCENCGGLVLVGKDGIEMSHFPRGSLSELSSCHNDVPDDAKSLKAKLQEREAADYERLKEI